MANERPFDEGLLQFLDRALHHGILSKPEEAALLRRAKAGDTKARDALIAANLRFLLMFARKHGQRSGMEVEDAFQEGAIGELRAMKKFDLGRGTRLSTYASWWVRQAIQRAGQDTARTVRLPANALNKLRDFRRALDRAEALQLELSDEDLAEMAGVDVKDIPDLRLLAVLSTVSLEEPIGEDGATLEDLCGDPATGPETATEHVARQERDFALRQAMATLSSLEQAVLHHRFDCERTLEETAAAVAPLHPDGRMVSRERIRQIQEGALRKLRATMTDADAP